MHKWSSGRIVACHAIDPGSIPGLCRNIFFDELEEILLKRQYILNIIYIMLFINFIGYDYILSYLKKLIIKWNNISNLSNIIKKDNNFFKNNISFSFINNINNTIFLNDNILKFFYIWKDETIIW